MKRRKSISKKPPLWSKFTQSRTTCRACNGPLETVLNLGTQEIISLGDKEKRVAPLELTKCAQCSLVQLRHTVDREYLFRSYYYRSGATQTMKDHLKGVVEDVMNRVKLKRGDVVVDIGANDGTLLSFYPNWKVWKIGFEPANIAPVGFGGEFVNQFFNADYFRSRIDPIAGSKVKVITTIAMFYDLDDPNAFLQDVKKVLAPDGLFVLQVNYLPFTLKNNAISDICHEHLCYYSLTTLGNLLWDNDFYIEDLSFNSINGGSVRLFIRHDTHLDSAKGTSAYAQRRMAEESKLNLDSPAPYQAFADRISAIARKTREYVETLRKLGKTVSVIGASTRGATFLQYANLNRYGILIDCVERDPSKVNKFYLGLPIVSEGADWDNPSDWYLITTPWLKDEIMNRMPYAKRFLVPLPEPRIVVDGVETPL